MKELKGLGEMIKDFDGTVIVDKRKPLTIKSVFTRQCGMFASKNPAIMIEAIDIGTKIHACNGTIRLEDAEIKVLIEAFSIPQMSAIAFVPAKKILERAEEIDTNAKHPKK